MCYTSSGACELSHKCTQSVELAQAGHRLAGEQTARSAKITCGCGRRTKSRESANAKRILCQGRRGWVHFVSHGKDRERDLVVSTKAHKSKARARLRNEAATLTDVHDPDDDDECFIKLLETAEHIQKDISGLGLKLTLRVWQNQRGKCETHCWVPKSGIWHS